MSEYSQNFDVPAAMLAAIPEETPSMPSPKSQAERVQFLVSLGQQPGVGAWFTVWRVATRKRLAAKTVKAMPRGSCPA